METLGTQLRLALLTRRLPFVVLRVRLQIRTLHLFAMLTTMLHQDVEGNPSSAFPTNTVIN